MSAINGAVFAAKFDAAGCPADKQSAARLEARNPIPASALLPEAAVLPPRRNSYRNLIGGAEWVSLFEALTERTSESQRQGVEVVAEGPQVTHRVRMKWVVVRTDVVMPGCVH